MSAPDPQHTSAAAIRDVMQRLDLILRDDTSEDLMPDMAHLLEAKSRLYRAWRLAWAGERRAAQGLPRFHGEKIIPAEVPEAEVHARGAGGAVKVREIVLAPAASQSEAA